MGLVGVGNGAGLIGVGGASGCSARFLASSRMSERLRGFSAKIGGIVGGMGEGVAGGVGRGGIGGGTGLAPTKSWGREGFVSTASFAAMGAGITTGGGWGTGFLAISKTSVFGFCAVVFCVPAFWARAKSRAIVLIC